MVLDCLYSYYVQLSSQYPFLTNLSNNYVQSALILIGAAILAWLLLLVFKKFLEKFASKTKTDLDDLILEKVKKPFFYLILAQGLKLALFNLEVNGIVTQVMNSIMALVFVFILSRAVEVVIEVWGRTLAKKTESKLDDVLLPMFKKASKIVFFVVAFMWVLNVWNIDITPYLAGVGISGLVLGFALQDSLKNIFGGITLILDSTFEVGDKIKLESGEVGEVKDIGLRSTKIRTYDNELIYVPNGYLANSRIQNYTRPSPTIRVKVDFGVEYGSDVKTVQKVVLKSISGMEDILSDPEPAVQFIGMGDSALNFRAMFWVKSWKDSYGRQLEATELVYNALNKAKIGIPFPTRTVYMKK
ncbi:MAG: mechanosensitive ion channel family protein [archaeon]|nr:mechanosensitive ion channel family protein [Nanoarchaeota archaeon]